MGKKQDAYYFNTFTACAEDACRAAQLLKSVLENFKPEELETQLEKLHEIEHSADEKKHDIMDHLAKEFIPPIEREDIVSLSQNIDNVTDKVEDILLRVYMNNVSRIGEDALAMMDVVVQCCEAVRELLEENVDLQWLNASDQSVWQEMQKVLNGFSRYSCVEAKAREREFLDELFAALQSASWRQVFDVPGGVSAFRSVSMPHNIP